MNHESARAADGSRRGAGARSGRGKGDGLEGRLCRLESRMAALGTLLAGMAVVVERLEKGACAHDDGR